MRRPRADLIVHATLLAVVAVVGWQTTTRATGASLRPKNLVVWTEPAGSLRKLSYKTGDRLVDLERRHDPYGDYVWVLASTSGLDGKPVEAHEYVAGVTGEALLTELESPHLLRDLGVVDASLKQAYKLDDPGGRMTLAFGSQTRELLVGDAVLGVRYVLEPKGGRAYAMRQDLFSAMDDDQSLTEQRIHVFDPAQAARATLQTGGGAVSLVRFDDEGGAGGWALASSPDRQEHSIGNLLERLDRLAIGAFAPHVSTDGLALVVRIDYARANGTSLGFLEVYRDQAPDATTRHYFLQTEHTRVPVELGHALGDQVERDVADVGMVTP